MIFLRGSVHESLVLIPRLGNKGTGAPVQMRMFASDFAVRNTKQGVEKDSGYTIALWPRWISR